MQDTGGQVVTHGSLHLGQTGVALYYEPQLGVDYMFLSPQHPPRIKRPVHHMCSLALIVFRLKVGLVAVTVFTREVYSHTSVMRQCRDRHVIRRNRLLFLFLKYLHIALITIHLFQNTHILATQMHCHTTDQTLISVNRNHCGSL